LKKIAAFHNDIAQDGSKKVKVVHRTHPGCDRIDISQPNQFQTVSQQHTRTPEI
jgi:hypothetical protein